MLVGGAVGTDTFSYFVWHVAHRCSFVKKVGGAQRVKSAQSTSKIRKNRGFSSDLVHFLTQVGGAQALPTEYVPTPLHVGNVCIMQLPRVSYFTASRDYFYQLQANKICT